MRPSCYREQMWCLSLKTAHKNLCLLNWNSSWDHFWGTCLLLTVCLVFSRPCFVVMCVLVQSWNGTVRGNSTGSVYDCPGYLLHGKSDVSTKNWRRFLQENWGKCNHLMKNDADEQLNRSDMNGITQTENIHTSGNFFSMFKCSFDCRCMDSHGVLSTIQTRTKTQ